MIALLDCNNFYVSCERLFDPKLINKPVVVLSNNDGCVISRSNEAKSIGIKMGEPLFKIKHLIKKFRVSVLSSNYSFYGDISNRIMRVLQKSIANVEVYSIDEAFFTLDMEIDKRDFFCNDLANKILQWTGIPVSIGIAPTKTLSKLVNYSIKKKKQYSDLRFKYPNVLEIKSKKELDYILANTNVRDIWGIGRGLSHFLIKNKINSALELKESNKNFARQKKGIILERTILELRGVSCYKIKTYLPAKKSICVSRSFGNKLNSYQDIKMALIIYVQRAASKMRNYGLFCKSISIFLKTSDYEKKKYQNTAKHTLFEATIDLRIIWKISKELLNKIYKQSFSYSKVGIILSDFCSKNNVQQSFLFSGDELQSDRPKNLDMKLMALIDEVNKRFGDGKLRLSSDENGFFYVKSLEEQKKKKWLMKSEYCSPCYTTNWYDIPKIKV